VLFEKRRQAFLITINRPEKRNALNAEVIAGLAKGDRCRRQGVLRRRRFAENTAAFAMDFSRPNADYADLLRWSHMAGEVIGSYTYRVVPANAGTTL
jgi:hypothetical protein